MAGFVDLTGQRFHYWEVISRAENSAQKKTQWLCRCICGTTRVVVGASLKNGLSKSCGCMSRTTAKDITGQRFGRLVAIKPLYSNKHRNIVWMCRCDCGNTVDVTVARLMNGNTLSCGCYQKDIASSAYEDLIGHRFGKLSVVELSGRGKYGLIWRCKCDCGNIVDVYRMNLKAGDTQSCGCTKSHGERLIREYLDSHHIEYIKEYSFDDCRNKKPMPFDFYLPGIGENGCCVEFDGIQHYQESKYFSDTTLDERVRRDKVKTEYCQKNNIKLLRIPYWEIDNIESILNDWLFLNDTEDANSSDVDLSA